MICHEQNIFVNRIIVYSTHTFFVILTVNQAHWLRNDSMTESFSHNICTHKIIIMAEYNNIYIPV